MSAFARLKPEEQLAAYQEAAMEPMFLNAPMKFDEMLAVLREAEQTLNQT